MLRRDHEELEVVDRRTSLPPGAKAGLYVHFPFCRRKCPYCHFASVPYERRLFEVWREGLEREADLRLRLGLEFETLYIGGGTPSILRPDEISELRNLLGRRLRLSLDEFTLEANPEGNLGRDLLTGWARAGVTRLSLGVQSFDDRTLKILGRDSSAARTRAFVRRARQAGFRSIGLDLMAGVPGETRRALEKTMDAVGALSPDHVSLYLLENVEGLPFEAVLRANPVGEDEAADAFDFAAAALESLGLRRYEISNFARPGHECRHNLKYWRYEPFLGLGPSAGSHAGAERWKNPDDLRSWSEVLAAGKDPREEIVRLDTENAVREAIVVGLRLVHGLDIDEFRRRFGVDIRERFGREIEELRKDKLLVLERRRLRIPKDKLLVSNRVLSMFV